MPRFRAGISYTTRGAQKFFRFLFGIALPTKAPPDFGEKSQGAAANPRY